MAFFDLVDRPSWDKLTEDEKFEAFCMMARAADQAVEASQGALEELNLFISKKIGELYAAGVIVKKTD